MPKSRGGIQITPIWKGDPIDIHIDGTIVNVPAPENGLHFAVPSACHFFVDARVIWDHLDTVVEGKKIKRKI